MQTEELKMHTVEEIAGYKVHPAASLFPLIDGKEFDDLVDSIRRNGVQHPAVLHDGLLIDGRNRMNAVERLKANGVDMRCPTVEWKPDGRNLAEWIWETNALRRHLTEDAMALASASITAMIRAENDQRQKAAQFAKGTSGNPSGKKQVTTKTESPAKRDRKESNARSTAGQVAAKAGVSMHKARQAIAVLDAVDEGTVTPEAVAEVRAGKKKLRDVVPRRGSRNRATPTKKSLPSRAAANNKASNKIFTALRVVRDKCAVLTKNRSKRREQAAEQLRSMADRIENDELLEEKQEEQATSEGEGFNVEEEGNALRDWLRMELDRWPSKHIEEAKHWIRQIVDKEFGPGSAKA
jgi:hypothetical protein